MYHTFICLLMLHPSTPLYAFKVKLFFQKQLYLINVLYPPVIWLRKSLWGLQEVEAPRVTR
jgi:hypothetical protein